MSISNIFYDQAARTIHPNIPERVEKGRASVIARQQALANIDSTKASTAHTEAQTEMMPRVADQTDRGLDLEERRAKDSEARTDIARDEEARKEAQRKEENKRKSAEANKVILEDPVTRDIIKKAIWGIEQTEDPGDISGITEDALGKIKAFYPDLNLDTDGDGQVSREEILAIGEALDSIPEVRPDPLSPAGKLHRDRQNILKHEGDEGLAKFDEAQKDGQDPTAAMQNAQAVMDVINNKDLTDEQKDAQLMVYGASRADVGVKISEDLAGNIADMLIDEHSEWFSNEPDAKDILTAALVIRFKKGGNIEDIYRDANRQAREFLGKAKEDGPSEDDGSPTHNMDNPATPETEEDYAALSAGDHYIDPDDGEIYVK